jgi:hypothetical protein
MSMFFSPKKLASLLVLLTLMSQNAFAWSGFDNDNNTTIDIGSGELVRTGLTISIFDWSTDDYHDVEVLFLESSFNGTRLEVFDKQTNKKRMFEMESQ